MGANTRISDVLLLDWSIAHTSVISSDCINDHRNMHVSKSGCYCSPCLLISPARLFLENSTHWSTQSSLSQDLVKHSRHRQPLPQPWPWRSPAVSQQHWQLLAVAGLQPQQLDNTGLGTREISYYGSILAELNFVEWCRSSSSLWKLNIHIDCRFGM